MSGSVVNENGGIFLASVLFLRGKCVSVCSSLTIDCLDNVYRFC